MSTIDPAVEAAYRALDAAIKKAAAPPVTRDQLTEMYRQGKYAQIDEMRQDGRLDHLLNGEPTP